MGAINDMKVSLALLLAFCPAEGSYVCYADDDAFDAAALAAECPEPTMANGANDNANRLTENNREYSQTHSSSFRREQRDRAKGWVPNFYYRTAYGQVSFALASADSGVFSSSSVYPTYRQRENGFAVFQDGQHQGSSVSAPYNTNFGSDGTAECQIPERLGGAGAPRNFCQKMRLFSRMNKDCVWYKGNYYHRKNFPVSELPKDDQGDLVIPSWVYTYFNSHMHHFWRTNLTGLMTPHDPEQFWSHWINGRMPMFSQAHAKWRYAINAAPNCNYKMAYFQNPSATAETSLGGGFTADFIANGFQYSNAAACNVPKPSQWSARFPSLTSTVTSLLGEEKGMKDGVLKNLGWTASGEYTNLVKLSSVVAASGTTLALAANFPSTPASWVTLLPICGERFQIQSISRLSDPVDRAQFRFFQHRKTFPSTVVPAVLVDFSKLAWTKSGTEPSGIPLPLSKAAQVSMDSTEQLVFSVPTATRLVPTHKVILVTTQLILVTIGATQVLISVRQLLREQTVCCQSNPTLTSARRCKQLIDIKPDMSPLAQ